MHSRNAQAGDPADSQLRHRRAPRHFPELAMARNATYRRPPITIMAEARYVEYLVRCWIFPELTSQTVRVSRKCILVSSGVNRCSVGMDPAQRRELSSDKCVIRFRILRTVQDAFLLPEGPLLNSGHSRGDW